MPKHIIVCHPSIKGQVEQLIRENHFDDVQVLCDDLHDKNNVVVIDAEKLNQDLKFSGNSRAETWKS